MQAKDLGIISTTSATRFLTYMAPSEEQIMCVMLQFALYIDYSV